MASLTGFIEGRLRLKINQDKSAVARPEDRHFLGFRLRLDPQTGTVEVLLSQRTKRNAMDRIRAAHAAKLGRQPGELHRPDQRVAARLARVLRDRLRLGDADDAQDRRPPPAPATRDHAAPLETQTNDRAQPHRARCQAAERVAAGLRGPQVLVGAEPHARSRSRPAQRVLREARAHLRWSSCTTADTSTSSPPTRHSWRYGDRSRSITGRRRGSQPAVPRSRVRTAHARFCGSRGGQPPRLPDRDRRPARPGRVRACCAASVGDAVEGGRRAVGLAPIWSSRSLPRGGSCRP